MKDDCPLDAYLDGVLSESDRTAFVAHLSDCRHCGAAIVRWRRLKADLPILVGAANPMTPNEQAAARLLQVATRRRAPESSKRPARWSPWVLAPGVAVAGLVIAGAIFRFGGSRPVALPQIERLQLDAPLVVIRPTVAPDFPLLATSGALNLPQQESLLVDLVAGRLGVATGGDVVMKRHTSRETELVLRAGEVAVHLAPDSRARRLSIVVREYHVEIAGATIAVRATPSEVSIAVLDGVSHVRSEYGPPATLPAGQVWQVSARGDRSTHALEDDEREHVLDLLREPGGIEEKTRSHPADEGNRTAGRLSKAAPNDRPPPPHTGVPVAEPSLADLQAWVVSGDLSRAEAGLTTYLKRKPDQIDAWLLLADTRRKAERYEAAVDALREVIERGDPTLRNHARLQTAIILQDELHHSEDAVRLLETVVAQPALIAELGELAALRLAKGYVTLDRPADAQRVLRGLTDNATDPGVRRQAAEFLTHLTASD